MTDQPIAPLTADDLNVLRVDHVVRDPDGEGEGPYCAACVYDTTDEWPCMTARLLATIDAAEQRATHAEAARDAARNLGALTAMKLAQQLEAGADDEAALADERAARERAEADVRRYAGDIYRMTKEIEALSVVASESRDRLKQAMAADVRTLRAEAER